MFSVSYPKSTDDLRANAKRILASLPLPGSSSASGPRAHSDKVSVTIEHIVRSEPSHVDWRAPTSYGRDLTRSVSSPSPTTRSKVRRHTSLRSTHSLRHYSPTVDGQHTPPPLSPIVEQDYLSPERRSIPLPVEPVVRTEHNSVLDEADHPFVTRPSPVYTTFLSRPLNRSISQSSSLSHLSTASIRTAPPVLPAIDLRPQFPGPGCPPPKTPPLRTPRVAVTLPVIEGTSDEDEDFDTSSNRAESFTTARSSHSPPLGDMSPPGIDAESVGWDISAEYGASPPVPSYQDECHPADEESSILPTPSQSVHDIGLASPYSRASTSSSFVDKRWMEGASFGGPPIVLAKKKAWQTRLSGVNAACLLFWLGFIAPWCWLIGGWLVNTHGHTQAAAEGRWRPRKMKNGSLLPLWSAQRLKIGQLPGPMVMGPGYPFIAPSIESLESTLALGSSTPAAEMRVQWRWEPDRRRIDKWVLRCRIAAVMSGFAMTVALIVVLAVMGKG
ncbi:hypothetical protein PLICRDRAFT_38578 [Plicaturopsis crispa FD-325 SS-3]|nr:hypothetical protein PLICRDRAFT_38578 [Plicaturopsis crispa FD-325 SS-3]